MSRDYAFAPAIGLAMQDQDPSQERQMSSRRYSRTRAQIDSGGSVSCACVPGNPDYPYQHSAKTLLLVVRLSARCCQRKRIASPPIAWQQGCPCAPHEQSQDSGGISRQSSATNIKSEVRNIFSARISPGSTSRRVELPLRSAAGVELYSFYFGNPSRTRTTDDEAECQTPAEKASGHGATCITSCTLHPRAQPSSNMRQSLVRQCRVTVDAKLDCRRLAHPRNTGLLSRIAGMMLPAVWSTLERAVQGARCLRRQQAIVWPVSRLLFLLA